MSKKLILTILLALIPAISSSASAEDLKSLQPSDKVLGNKNAKVTIIEYASLSCGHCADFHNDILPEVKREYIDTGKVKFIFRNFPLNASALVAAKVADCTTSKTGDKKYFSFLDTLFMKQKEWAFDGDFKDKLFTIAESEGVKKEALEKCLADEDVERKILEGSKAATENLGIKSTPYFLINGEKIGGISSASVMKEFIDTILGGKSIEEERVETAKNLMNIQSSDIVLGKEDAPVTVIEYSNIGCPHCAEAHKNLIKILQAEYIDTGKVKFAFRELPMNPSVFYAYMTAYCKGTDQFYPMLSKLIDGLQSWTSTPAFLAPLRKIAENEGISKDEFYSCLENQSIADKINKTHKDAGKLGVNHSPAIFVNGKAVDGHGGNDTIINAIKSAM